MAAGKQFVQGEPHFYVKRCLFGCPEPCHKTGIEQLTYLMFIRSLDEKELVTEEFESMAGEKMEHLFPASAAGHDQKIGMENQMKPLPRQCGRPVHAVEQVQG